MIKQMLIAVVLGWLWLGVVSAGQAEEGKVLQALQLLGMEGHFTELNYTLVRGLNQRRLEGVASGALSYAELEELLNKYFDPQLLNRLLAKSLLDSYDPNRFNLLLSSLRSEQIQDVRLRVERAAAPDNLPKLREYADGYSAAPLSQQSSYIIDGLDRAMAGNEIYAGVQALATLTMMRLQEVLEGIEPQFAEDLLLQQLYTDYLKSGRYTSEMIYRSALGDISPENLQLSLRVYRSTVVQWFLGAAVDNMTLVVSQQREQLFKVIGEAKKPSTT